MSVCTVVAKNYAAHARVLARSLASHHPGLPLHVLVIDDFEGYLDPAEEPFEVVTPAELNIETFEEMASVYDVVELSTAVKPWLLRWLLNRSPDGTAVYLDPDMRLYAPLDDMLDAVREHDIVLSPHNIEPMPRDGKRPSEQDILIAGAYNLGFIGVRAGAGADQLLDWWSERLKTDCLVEPERGLFVDQRWIDFAPGMADSVHLLRDPGFNVAYWNLPTRAIARTGGDGWTAADAPLRLFHFSGFDPRQPNVLSKHQDRIDLSDEPDLAELCGSYAQELGEAGVEEVREWPYSLVPVQPRHSGVSAGTALAALGPPGVNVVGYLNAELGVGEVARQAVNALDAASVPVLPVGIPAPHTRQGHEFAHAGVTKAGYPVNLVCVNADVLPEFVAGVGPGFFANRRSIGWWWWEVEQFPERWLGSFDHLDEVWAGSQFVAETLALISPIPVLSMLTPVSVAGEPRPDPDRFGLPSGYRFLFSFDYASVLERKNPLGCLAAFLRAFPQPGEAVLVLKSINAHRFRSDYLQLRRAAADHPHVVLIDDYLDPGDKDRLLATCDCYVSLHRAEGFGISMAEAMYLGKPVIATGYSGNREYMTPQNSYLVDFELRPIGEFAEPYPPDARWAEPDLDHAAKLMREVFTDREESLRRGERAQSDIRRTHSPEAAGAKMARRLGVIASQGLPSGNIWEAPGVLDLADAADGMLQAGHTPGPPLPGGRVREFARRTALRLMRPHTAYQHTIDRNLVDALRALARDVRDMGERRVVGEAAFLGGLRAARTQTGGIDRRVDDVGRQAEDVGRQAADTAQRTEDVVRRLDTLEAGVRRQGELLSMPEVADDADPEPDSYPTAPGEPWSEEYVEAHRQFLRRALADSELIEAMQCGEDLPEGYGLGFDERVVELPWLAGRSLDGTVLDAGSTLNHLHLLRRLRPRMNDLHIVTLAAEDRAFPTLGISYLYADLRRLPLRDDTYDRVLSVSTLEHVGLDLEHFGANGGASPDPQAEALKAADELRRVLRPGGEAVLTVPIGVPEHFGWVRSLSLEELDALVERFDPLSADIAFFRHDGGWKRAGRDSVETARYRDHLGAEDPRDGVVAAEAVACVALTAP